MLAGTSTPDGYTVNADGAWVHDGSVQTKQVQAIAPSAASSQSVEEFCAAAQDMKNGTGESNAKYGEVKVVVDDYRTYVTYANGLTIRYWDDVKAGYRDGSNSKPIVYKVETPVEADGNPKVNEYGAYGISMAALDMHSHTRQENAKYGEVDVRDYNYEILVYYANGLCASYYLPNAGRSYELQGNYPDMAGTEVPKPVFKEDVTGKSGDVAKALKRKNYSAYENGFAYVILKDVGDYLQIHELDEYGRQYVRFY